MNAAIKNITWFIDGGDGPLWRVNPDDYTPDNRPTVYVRLDDVLALLEETNDGSFRLKPGVLNG